MDEKMKIETTSIRGTKFTIEFEIDKDGKLKLPNSPNKARNWKFENCKLYERNKDLKALIFIMTFFQQNHIKLIQLSVIDLVEIITLLLELPKIRKQCHNGTVRYEHSQKALIYAHSLMDLYIMMKGV